MKIGSVVMFTDGAAAVRHIKHTLHSAYPEYYPSAKTIGAVVEFGECGWAGLVKIQWPAGSTSGNDSWWCHPEFLLEL